MFAVGDFVTESFEIYAPLDSLGRCGTAYENIGIDIMPTEERGKIGYVKPSGWQTVKYDFVDGKYLYNRCHLIGYQLSGENANIRNLITGTRYLNTEGMLPFENMVADYVKETGNHVLYRVTPVFEGNNLIASGVLIEVMSVEDEGIGICFCVFCYNVQPGVQIDYATGMSEAIEVVVEETVTPPVVNNGETEVNDNSNTMSYVANKNTKKFHYPSCSSVGEMKERNKKYMEATREEMITNGYSPCSRRDP
ncbi:MAG: DNA/RNA non-specific endonuclease [Clostridia bacterium]